MVQSARELLEPMDALKHARLNADRGIARLTLRRIRQAIHWRLLLQDPRRRWRDSAASAACHYFEPA
jgi:hypothetical protein